MANRLESAQLQRIRTLKKSTKTVLRERAAGALSAVIKKPDRKRKFDVAPWISAAKLAAQLTMMDESPANHYGQVSRYLISSERGDRPNSGSAWDVGEALNDLGVTWASGLWMLYACGRFDDFAGVIAIFLRETMFTSLQHENDAALRIRDDIWQMVATAKQMSLSTKLDGLPEIAELHISGETDIARINKLAQSLRRKSRLSPIDFDRAHLLLLWRERSKRPWLKYSRYRIEFKEAFDIWSAERFVSAPDEFARAAIALAREPDLDLWIKERAVRLMLSYTLANLFKLFPENALGLPSDLEDSETRSICSLLKRMTLRDDQYLDMEFNDEYISFGERRPPKEKKGAIP